MNPDLRTQLPPVNLQKGVLPARDSMFEEAPPTVALPAGMGLKEFLTSHSPMRLLWKNEADRAESLIFEFAQRGVPKQVFRWTGWAGSIGEHGSQLSEMVRAFSGVKGFHMFGGTQIRSLDDGSVIPMVSDIPVKLKQNDHDLILVGIIPKVSEEPLYREGLGIVLGVDEKNNRFTTINDDQNIGIVLQPDVNGHYGWIDEIIESRRQCSRLMDKKWSGNLVVFGGTTTAEGDLKLRNVEQELVWWAKDAQDHSEWDINIILIRGSGGVADKYASNAEWLAANPRVKVFDASAEAIRSGIAGLNNIITDWKE